MASTQTIPPAAALVQARAAVDEHRWQAAVELFAVADEAGLLTPDDLDLLGNAEWWTGSMTRSIAAEERAYAGHTAAGDTRRAARTALSLVTEYSHRLEGSVASGWLRRAERLLEGTPESREHGLLERARRNAAYGRGELEAALEHSSRVFEIGNRLGDRDLIGLGMQDQGRVLIELGRVEEGMALLEEAMVAAVGDELSPRAAAIVYCNATIICEDVADYRRAADFAEAAERWCDRQHIAGFPGMCRVRRAEIIRLTGDWKKAESEARLACEELRDFSIAYAGEGFYQIGEIRLRLGDFAAAAKSFAEAHELGRDPQPGLAMLHLAQGRTDAARSLLSESLGNPIATPLERAHLLPAQVEVSVAAGDVDQARAAADEMSRLADRYGTHALRASAADATGRASLAAGDIDAAVASFRQSWRIWQELSAPYETARARASLGRALIAGGRTDAAAQELRSAIAVFERLGAEPDLKAAHGELERIEGPSASEQPAGRLGACSCSPMSSARPTSSRRLAMTPGNRFFAGMTTRSATSSSSAEARSSITRATGSSSPSPTQTRPSRPPPPSVARCATTAAIMASPRPSASASMPRRRTRAAAVTPAVRARRRAHRVACCGRRDPLSQDALAAASRPVSHGPLRTEKLKGIRDSVSVATSPRKRGRLRRSAAGSGHPFHIEEAVEVLEGEGAVADVATLDDHVPDGLALGEGLLGDARRLLVA